MQPIDRRQFLQDSAALAAGLSLAGAVAAQAEDKPSTRKKLSANDTVRMAVIGVRGRGMEHISGWNALDDVRIATICDVDRNVIGKAMKAVERRNGSEPKFEQDLRRVFDDRSIDAVSIATPNHWHALAAIWAMQADKDVYVEKPVSHNISEGRRTVEMARK